LSARCALLETAEETSIVEKIFRSLVPKFNFVACAIEESKYINKLSLDGLPSSLKVHEKKFKQLEVKEQAMKLLLVLIPTIF